MGCLGWIAIVVLIAGSGFLLIRRFMIKAHSGFLRSSISEGGIATTWKRPNGDFRCVSTVFKGNVFETIVASTPLHFRHLGCRHGMNSAEAAINHVTAIAEFLNSDPKRADWSRISDRRLNQFESQAAMMLGWDTVFFNSVCRDLGIPDAQIQ